MFGSTYPHFSVSARLTHWKTQSSRRVISQNKSEASVRLILSSSHSTKSEILGEYATGMQGKEGDKTPAM
jgi:hypothetical protein